MRSQTRIISLKEKKSFVLFFFFFSSRFKSFIYCTLIEKESLISGPLFFFSFLFGAAGPPTQIVSSSSHVGRSSRRRRSQIFERHKKGPRKINIYLFLFFLSNQMILFSPCIKSFSSASTPFFLVWLASTDCNIYIPPFFLIKTQTAAGRNYLTFFLISIPLFNVYNKSIQSRTLPPCLVNRHK